MAVCHPDNFYHYNGTRKIEYIVVHYTAGKGDSAESNLAYFRNNSVGASAHYFVDKKDVRCLVDDNDIAYAVGTAGCYTQKHPKCFNSNSLSIEMCTMPDRYSIAPETEDRCAKLVAFLMIKYQIPMENVLRHWDVVNKPCPAPFIIDSRWKQFKKEVWRLFGKQCYEAIKEYLMTQECPIYFREELEEAKNLGITDGKTPMMFVTRVQAAVMAKRAVKGK